jgi:Tfp pilus assembly protein PilO
LVSAIASGCASDKSANPAMPSASQPPADRDVVWANKVIELGWVQEYTKRQTEELDKQRQSAYKQMVRMASQQNELQDVVDAIDNIKREAKADNELSDWVANNQDQLKASFTDKLGQTKQERFESLGLQGEVLKDWVDEVTVQGKMTGKTFYQFQKSSFGRAPMEVVELQGFNWDSIMRTRRGLATRS